MAKKLIELQTIKLGFLGEAGVGKTSLCNVFLGYEFKGDTLMTIGVDKYEARITLKNGKNIKLILLDTAGQERFRSLAYSTLRTVHGIIVVFDLTNRDSFKNIDAHLEEIKEKFDNKITILLGNKSDIKESREVSNEEIEQYIKQKKIVYLETSAKLNQGINEAVSYIANEVYDKEDLNINNNILIDNSCVDKDINNNCCNGKKRRKKKKKKSK